MNIIVKNSLGGLCEMGWTYDLQYLNSLMDIRHVIWISTLILTFVAAWLDWRTRRIPNWLTVSGLLLGITVNSALTGWHGAKLSLAGAVLALAIPLPLVLLRGLGAGDWKLLGAVGAMLGPILFLFVLFGTILASALMALVQMLRTGRVLETIRNLFVLVRGFFSFGLNPHPQISLDNPRLLKLPFGVAVAVATLICFCAAHWAV
jgi:prepilin peptidase CpaA